MCGEGGGEGEGGAGAGDPVHPAERHSGLNVTLIVLVIFSQ